MLSRDRRMPLALLAVLVASLAAGCGPSAAEARRAEHVVYQTEFARVWNAVAETVRDQYPRLVIEDPIRGKLLTDWHLVERVDDDPIATGGAQGSAQTQGAANQANQIGQGQVMVQAGKFFRISVIIKPGGPPWRLEIDGEAALYQPGMAMITPYDHADADEPSWVKPRIDKIRVGIYRRLGGYARVVEEAPKKAEALDPGPWANLPKGAPDLVARVNAAAHKKDTVALRRLMIDAFAWSPGGAPSSDAAISMWSADPLLLAALVKTLEAGCSEREPDALIVCPTRSEGAARWHVEFRKQGGAWRFAAFYQEE
jgi:hypothetical protein